MATEEEEGFDMLEFFSYHKSTVDGDKSPVESSTESAKSIIDEELLSIKSSMESDI
ncbi:hypothetical protein OROGR_001285 [Orobanche gracilis]